MMKRIAHLALAAIVAFCLIFLGGTSVKAQGGSTSSTTSTSWTGPGGVTWTIVQSLSSFTPIYNQPGHLIQGPNGPISVPTVPGLEVKWVSAEIGYADTPIIAFSTNDGTTWQNITAEQILPTSWLTTGQPAVNGMLFFFTDLHLPQVFLLPTVSGPLYPFIVGTYSNGAWTWSWQKVRWYTSENDSPFDPKWPGVVYSDLVGGFQHLSISDNSGWNWTTIPTIPQLRGYNLEIVNISRDSSNQGTDLWVTSWNPQTKINGPSATVFIPDSVIQNPSLMTITPVSLSLKIGSPELIVTKNGIKTTMVLDAKPIVLDGRTMLPIRPIVEALGGAIGYSDGVVSITQGSNSVTLRIGDNTAVVNGQDVPIDQNPNVKPFIVPPGRTMLPLRFVAEALGAQVNYLGAGNIAIAYPNPNPSQ